MKRLLPALVILAAVAVTPAAAQTRQAESSITVERSVGVTTVSRMVFDPASTTRDDGDATDAVVASPRGTSLTRAGSGDASAPAVIEVWGDPGRTYRVHLPQSVAMPETNATISGFTIWSENSGDITDTLTARMDNAGRDTLRVSGTLSAVTLQEVSAAIPITVNYE